MRQHREPRFELGAIYITPGAASRCAEHIADVWYLLARHVWGDWGDLDEEDRAVNDRALADGGTLRSWYQLDQSVPRNVMGGVWIVTEASRKTTTITTPEED